MATSRLNEVKGRGERAARPLVHDDVALEAAPLVVGAAPFRRRRRVVRDAGAGRGGPDAIRNSSKSKKKPLSWK